MRRNKKELIASNKFLMSLPGVPRAIVGIFMYRTKEILLFFILALVLLVFALTFNYNGKKFQWKSVETEIKIGGSK